MARLLDLEITQGVPAQKQWVFENPKIAVEGNAAVGKGGRGLAAKFHCELVTRFQFDGDGVSIRAAECKPVGFAARDPCRGRKVAETADGFFRAEGFDDALGARGKGPLVLS